MPALLSMRSVVMIIIGFIIHHILAGDRSIKGQLIWLDHIAGGDTVSDLRLETLKTHACGTQHDLCSAYHGNLGGAIGCIHMADRSGTRNALFLMQMLNTQINLRGLLLGGMVRRHAGGIR